MVFARKVATYQELSSVNNSFDDCTWMIVPLVYFHQWKLVRPMKSVFDGRIVACLVYVNWVTDARGFAVVRTNFASCLQ